MNEIAVVDNGGQFTHLIATVIRNDCHVHSIIVEPTIDVSELAGCKGIILSGGPASIYDPTCPPFNEKILEMDVPILGLCYGHHQIGRHYGGEVAQGDVKEFGFAQLEVIEPEGILASLSEKERVWMSHGDEVSVLPEGFKVIGTTSSCKYAAVADDKRKRYGFQFHPEVEDTLNGRKMLSNFVHNICGCSPSWTMESYLGSSIENIREQVGDRSVFFLVSGGVDSSVCAALLEKALPSEQVALVHIDNGLMRKDESEQVARSLKKAGVEGLIVVDASERFVNALAGVTEPEAKRKIIGSLFIDVADEEASRMELGDWLLGQGTIYPDTIETGGTAHADTIKTHHNRVSIVQEMIKLGKVIEPISDLYKAEVRELGRQIGLDDSLLNRHPFPGPGLGVRLLCNSFTTPDDTIPSLQDSVNDFLRSEKATGIVLPIKSVGVKGDARSYEHPVLLSSTLDHDTLKSLSTRMTNAIRGINRVALLLSPSSFSNASLLEGYVTNERLETLREADALVMKALSDYDLLLKIWQCPTVLVPVSLNGSGELVIIRPVYSNRAMTAEAAPLPKELLEELLPKLMSLDGVGAVALDLTNKPPGTIEWE